jgi:hypothetical protein
VGCCLVCGYIPGAREPTGYLVVLVSGGLPLPGPRMRMVCYTGDSVLLGILLRSLCACSRHHTSLASLLCVQVSPPSPGGTPHNMTRPSQVFRISNTDY